MVTWVWDTWVLIYDIIKYILGTLFITTLSKTEPTETKMCSIDLFVNPIRFHANTVL